MAYPSISAFFQGQDAALFAVLSVSIILFLVISSFEAKIPLTEGWHKKQYLPSSSLVRWTVLIFPACYITENEFPFQNTPLNMFFTLL